MVKNGKRLLVVDDVPEIGNFVRAVATECGFESIAATCQPDFKKVFSEFGPTHVVLDLALADGDGIELLKFLSAKNCTASIVLISTFDPKVLNAAMQLGEQHGLHMLGHLQKPLTIEDLQAVLSCPLDSTPSICDATLSKAIEAGELIAYYQPKIDLSALPTHRVTEVEALVRWDSPAHGLLLPGRFLPIAERNDLLLPLTLMMTESACRQMAEWDREGIEVSVAVNVPPSLLENLQLPDLITEIARKHNVRNSRLTLEITESGVMKDTTAAMEILTRFRLKGFKLSMDDFGTGFSSLLQLYRMPFNEIKIDRSFVKDVCENEEARVIVRTITDLAHGLGLPVCAEGVEDQRTLDLLATLGCESAQGFFIGRPMPGCVFSQLHHACSGSGEKPGEPAKGKPARGKDLKETAETP